MVAWKRKGWRTASGGAALTRDHGGQQDGARLPGLALVHVRGHSGDPDNDRCDAIAVAFARGQRPRLAGAGPLESAAADSPGDGAPRADAAPPGLQQLLSRLELADRLAAGGYALTLVELAQLVELPVRSLEERQEPWAWRDWLVQPLPEGRWRLQRGTGGLAQRP
jgi:ribonuclease HI